MIYTRTPIDAASVCVNTTMIMIKAWRDRLRKHNVKKQEWAHHGVYGNMDSNSIPIPWNIYCAFQDTNDSCSHFYMYYSIALHCTPSKWAIINIVGYVKIHNTIY